MAHDPTTPDRSPDTPGRAPDGFVASFAHGRPACGGGSCLRRPTRLTATVSLAALLLTVAGVLGTGGCTRKVSRSILAQELFLGMTPYPQERNELQATVGLARFVGDEAVETEGWLEAEYGLTDRLQVGVGLPYVHRRVREADDDEDARDADGLGDLEVNALYNLLTDEDPLVLSAALDVDFPTGDEDKELGEGVIEYQPAVLASRRFGDFEVYGGLGGSFTRNASGYTYFAAALWSCGLLSPVVELAGEKVRGEHEAYLTPGLILNPTPALEFSIGVPLGLNHDSEDWGIMIQAIFELSLGRGEADDDD